MISSVRFGNNCKLRLYDSTEDDLAIVRDIVDHRKKKQQEEAFFLADFDDIVLKYNKWKQLLPRVQPFYAVKTNPDIAVLRLLAHLGLGFDCASKAEIRRVLTLGVNPSRIIYAHTCKNRSWVQYAGEEGVNLMTFDNEEELVKIHDIFPSAQ